MSVLTVGSSAIAASLVGFFIFKPVYDLKTEPKPTADTVRNASYSLRMNAFLATIRWAETGTSGPESYKKIVFGGKFNNFSTHPRVLRCSPINGRKVCSTAAGAYQMLNKSFDDVAPKLGLTDFTPASQDKMAIEYIRRNRALEDVEAGRFESAVKKVGRIWASFPANEYGQNAKPMSTLRTYYNKMLERYNGEK